MTSLSERLREVFITYFPLAFITFGGPQAHIALYLSLFVEKKGWLSEEMFAELYAISNALPGPASTQLAFTVALIRGGIFPAILSFILWSLPGGIVMGLIGYGVGRLGASNIPLWLIYIQRGLASVSIALVVLAAKKLSAKLLIDQFTCSLAAVAVALVINFSQLQWLIPVLIIFGGVAAYLEHIFISISKKTNSDFANNSNQALTDVNEQAESSSVQAQEAIGVNEISSSCRNEDLEENSHSTKDLHIYFTYSIRTGVILVLTYFGILVLSIILRPLNLNQPLDIFTTFYFVGAIIFGGGPVVVPLLYSYVVSGPNWLSNTEFLMGFALINAMPGPNFNFAAYCGALAFRKDLWTSFVGAFLAWLGIFMPGLLVKTGVLPIWRAYRGLQILKIIFRGFNAIAIGILIAAIYLLWEKAIALKDNGVADLGSYSGWTAILVIAFVFMDSWNISGQYVVLGGGIVGILAWLIDGKPI